MFRQVSATLVAGVVLASCAGSQPGNDVDLISDPFEDFNRAMYVFNDRLDVYVIGPAATAYEVATPRLFREGVGNFSGNLGEPVTFANQILQGKPGPALDTFFRFGINSTIGILGIFDVASEMGLKGQDEDFGQTLAVWGVDSGPYIVLPLLGPTTPRDFVGFGIDRAFDPHNHLNWQADYLNNDEDFDRAFRISVGVLSGLTARVNIDDQIETLRSQPEPYIALRRAYISGRNAAIRDGQGTDDPYSDLPDYDSFDLDDEGMENEE